MGARLKDILLERMAAVGVETDRLRFVYDIQPYL